MKFFRLLSVIEGVSLLTLLFVAIPLRTHFDMPEAVTYMGWTHGVLFLFYGATALVVSHQQGWSILRWLVMFLLGAVPFGFLYVDFQLRRLIREATAGESA
jgi:integral membrane protein